MFSFELHKMKERERERNKKVHLVHPLLLVQMFIWLIEQRTVVWNSDMSYTDLICLIVDVVQMAVWLFCFLIQEMNCVISIVFIMLS